MLKKTLFIFLGRAMSSNKRKEIKRLQRKTIICIFISESLCQLKEFYCKIYLYFFQFLTFLNSQFTIISSGFVKLSFGIFYFIWNRNCSFKWHWDLRETSFYDRIKGKTLREQVLTTSYSRRMKKYPLLSSPLLSLSWAELRLKN